MCRESRPTAAVHICDLLEAEESLLTGAVPVSHSFMIGIIHEYGRTASILYQEYLRALLHLRPHNKKPP